MEEKKEKKNKEKKVKAVVEKPKKEKKIKEHVEKPKKEKNGETKSIWLSKEVIIAAAAGLIVGLLLTYVFFANQAVARINGKTVTKDEYYDLLNKYYSIDLLLYNKIDRMALDTIYTLTDKEQEEVKEEADYWINYYTTYGYTEQQFYEANGCKDKAEFIEVVESNYKAQKYYYEYLAATLEEGAIEKYYEENKDTVNKFDSKHMLVQVNENMTDEQALALANEIIAKLDAGETFTSVKQEYADKITYEELGFTNAKSGLEESYSTALEALEDGTYTKTPVKTSYGYHIIYRIATSTIDDVRNDIIDILTEDLQEADSNLYYKAFIEMREKYNLKFYDKKLQEKYDAYCIQYQ